MKLSRLSFVSAFFAALAACAFFAGCSGSSENNNDGGDAEADIETTADAEQETLPPFDDPAEAGKYGIGIIKATVTDAARNNRTLPCLIWYPSYEETEPFYYQDAFRRDNVNENATPAAADAPYPLLVFSHGNSGMAEQSWTMMEFFAAHGFVVASCDHVGNTAADFAKDNDAAEKAMPQSVYDRPLDITLLIDNLLVWNKQDGHALKGIINPDKIAMSGHSFGGYTTMRVSGASLSVEAFKEACVKDPLATLCDYLTGYDLSMIKDGQSMDARVKTAVPLAPAGFQFFQAAGVEPIKIPMMLMVGDGDHTCPLDGETQPMYDSLKTPKALVTVVKAAHMSFTNLCAIVGGINDYLRREGCDKEKFISADETYKAVNRYALAWIRRYLYDDARYDEILKPTDPAAHGISATIQIKQ